LVDPRSHVIARRLAHVARVIAVSSGKGGVGKSLVAATLALSLSRDGLRVGLFDLDFTGPSAHIILNTGELKPKEDKGLIPPEVDGLKFMSIVYYSGVNPAPLRGVDTSNALIELFSVTLWNNLDCLIIDMPPGIGDAVLDLLRFVNPLSFLIVTTPSKLAFETVKKQVALLKEVGTPIIGVIENMKTTVSDEIRTLTESLGVKYLGALPYDTELEDALGNRKKLLKTLFARKLHGIIQENLKP